MRQACYVRGVLELDDATIDALITAYQTLRSSGVSRDEALARAVSACEASNQCAVCNFAVINEVYR
jgi:hypothetical protein